MKKQLFLIKKYQKQAGQSIVEVLIATAVVGAVLTAVAAGLTYSVRNSAESKFRDLATYKAQEAMEVFRRERNNLGWESFESLMISGATYCFNSLPATTDSFATALANPGDCTVGVADSGTEFRREVTTVVGGGGSEVNVQVVTTWYDGTFERNVSIQQNFRQFNP